MGFARLSPTRSSQLDLASVAPRAWHCGDSARDRSDCGPQRLDWTHVGVGPLRMAGAIRAFGLENSAANEKLEESLRIVVVVLRVWNRPCGSAVPELTDGGKRRAGRRDACIDPSPMVLEKRHCRDGIGLRARGAMNGMLAVDARSGRNLRHCRSNSSSTHEGRWQGPVSVSISSGGFGKVGGRHA